MYVYGEQTCVQISEQQCQRDDFVCSDILREPTHITRPLVAHPSSGHQSSSSGLATPGRSTALRRWRWVTPHHKRQGYAASSTFLGPSIHERPRYEKQQPSFSWSNYCSVDGEKNFTGSASLCRSQKILWHESWRRDLFAVDIHVPSCLS